MKVCDLVKMLNLTVFCGQEGLDTEITVRIAQGKFPPDSIPEIIQAKDRHKAGPTAPPEGLYLNQVIY